MNDTLLPYITVRTVIHSGLSVSSSKYKLSKVDGQTVESFELWLGGSLGPNSALATKLQGSIPADHAGPVLKAVIDFYTENKQSTECFTSFVQRIGVGAFEEKLNEFFLAQSN